jgi:hypothetical protein
MAHKCLDAINRHPLPLNLQSVGMRSVGSPSQIVVYLIPEERPRKIAGKVAPANADNEHLAAAFGCDPLPKSAS